MKKITALLLLLALVLTLCACGEDDAAGDDQVITRSTEDTSAADAVQDTTTGDTLSVTPHFAYEGVELVPGAVFDPASRVTELYGEDYVLDGTAYVYTYEAAVLTVVIQNDTVLSIEYRQLLAGE